MKKTLVAVAAIAAFSAAHAEVTISGVFEAAYRSTGGSTSMIGGTNGSEINFSVSEDLGNGLKAIANTAVIHNLTDGQTQSGAGGATPSHGTSTDLSVSSVNTYQSFVGLSGEFGSVKLGQLFSPTFLASTIGDVNGRSGISNYLAGGSSGQVANSITYNSPAFQGVSLSYQQVLNNSVDSFRSWAINYSAGAFNAAYSAASTAGTDKETVVAASYDFGMAKLHAGYSTFTGEKSSTGYGISIPFGAVVLSYGSSTGYDAINTLFGNTTEATETHQMLQATYNFSKRTNAYYAYTNNSTTGTAANIIGVRHNF